MYCYILHLARWCEGDSLISTISRDRLSTNETHEKENFDDWYIIIDITYVDKTHNL